MKRILLGVTMAVTVAYQGATSPATAAFLSIADNGLEPNIVFNVGQFDRGGGFCP